MMTMRSLRKPAGRSLRGLARSFGRQCRLGGCFAARHRARPRSCVPRRFATGAVLLGGAVISFLSSAERALMRAFFLFESQCLDQLLLVEALPAGNALATGHVGKCFFGACLQLRLGHGIRLHTGTTSRKRPV